VGNAEHQRLVLGSLFEPRGRVPNDFLRLKPAQLSDFPHHRRKGVFPQARAEVLPGPELVHRVLRAVGRELTNGGLSWAT